VTGELRAAGIRTDLAYGNKGLKGAMKGADRSGALLTVIVGDRDLEASDGPQAQVKDMISGEQSAVPVSDLVAVVAAQLKENLS
jgi:histidyl-tRNA synthetase